MSGLVPGLQNQLERFDSASDLQHNSWFPKKSAVFFIPPPPLKQKQITKDKGIVLTSLTPKKQHEA